MRERVMRTLIFILGLCLLLGALWDVFETIVLPKRVAANYRFALLFYLTTWKPWRQVGKSIHNDKRRESFLSIYGPLLMLGLLALWAGLLVLAFGLLNWGAGTQLQPQEKPHTFFTYLYFSGTTLFPLGMGGLTPGDRLGSILAILEAATGFGVLALVIG